MKCCWAFELSEFAVKIPDPSIFLLATGQRDLSAIPSGIYVVVVGDARMQVAVVH